MINNHFLLVYDVENLSAATPLGYALQQADFKVEYYGLSPDTVGKDTYAQVVSRSEPVIVLISDNFLKSEAGMDQALTTIQELYRKNRLIPVITDGISYNERTGTTTNHTTSFERVSNVIQYMNYWQDKYLELRKTKKEIGTPEEDSHQEQVKSVRAISTEIGELLRFLRSIDCYHYDELSGNNFLQLRQMLRPDENGTFTPADNLEAIHESNGVEKISSQSGYATTYADYQTKTTEQPPAIPQTQVETADETEEEQETEGGEPKFDEIIEIIQAEVNQEQKQSEVDSVHQMPQDKVESPAPIADSITTQSIKNAYIETLLEEAEDQKSIQQTGFRSQLNDIVEEVVAEENGYIATDDYLTDESIEKDPELSSLFQEDRTETEIKVPMEDLFFMPSKETPETEINRTSPHFYEEEKESSHEASHEIPDDDEDADDLHIAKDFEAGFDDEETELDEVHIKQQVSQYLSEPVPDEITHILPSNEGQSEEADDNAEATISASNESPNTEDNDPEPDNISNKNEEVTEKLAEALEWYANGHPQNGRTAFEQLIQQYPDSSDIRIAYARCLVFQEYNPTAALQELHRAVSLDPHSIAAYKLMGEIAELQKDYFSAQHYYNLILELNPEEPGIHYRLGMLTNLHFKGQRKRAAKYFKQAYELDPGNGDAGMQYANILLEHFGKVKKATRYYHEILRKHPENDQAWLALADIYYENADQASAHDCYMKALDINPALQQPDLDIKYAYTVPVTEEIPAAEVLEQAPVYPPDNGITVLLTGATSGIGLATAELLAAHGYRLILTGRRKDRLQDLEKSLKERYNSRLISLNFDVRNQQDTQNALASLEAEWGQVDILINNAGLASGLDPIYEGAISDWETMIDTNIKGVLYMTRAISPGMVARKNGHIINISSIAAIDAYPKGNVYCATKAAVDMLTKAMRLDLYQHGVRVSQVSPGHVEETEFARVRFHWDLEKANIYQDFQPLKASDVAEAIYFMISRPAYVNVNDVVLSGTQQANTVFINRSGRAPESALE